MAGAAKYQVANNVFIFSLTGYIEKSVTEVCKEKFREQWQKGIRQYLFDFSAVTIINSVALADILEMVSEGLGESEAGFYICGVPEKCHWGLLAIGLLNYMTEYESFAQAKTELGL